MIFSIIAIRDKLNWRLLQTNDVPKCITLTVIFAGTISHKETKTQTEKNNSSYHSRAPCLSEWQRCPRNFPQKPRKTNTADRQQFTAEQTDDRFAKNSQSKVKTPRLASAGPTVSLQLSHGEIALFATSSVTYFLVGECKHLIFTSSLASCPSRPHNRLEITVPVGWALNTNN